MPSDELLEEILNTMGHSRTKEEILEHCARVGISLEEYLDHQKRALAARKVNNPNYPNIPTWDFHIHPKN